MLVCVATICGGAYLTIITYSSEIGIRYDILTPVAIASVIAIFTTWVILKGDLPRRVIRPRRYSRYSCLFTPRKAVALVWVFEVLLSLSLNTLGVIHFYSPVLIWHLLAAAVTFPLLKIADGQWQITLEGGLVAYLVRVEINQRWHRVKVIIDPRLYVSLTPGDTSPYASVEIQKLGRLAIRFAQALGAVPRRYRLKYDDTAGDKISFHLLENTD